VMEAGFEPGKRRACRLVGMGRSSYRYVTQKRKEVGLRERP